MTPIYCYSLLSCFLFSPLHFLQRHDIQDVSALLVHRWMTGWMMYIPLADHVYWLVIKPNYHGFELPWAGLLR